jgi:hypothetical protein
MNQAYFPIIFNIGPSAEEARERKEAQTAGENFGPSLSQSVPAAEPAGAVTK